MMRPVLAALAALMIAAPATRSAEPEPVSFRSLHRDGTMLQAYLMKPDGEGPFPAIALFHGCGGPLTAKGAIASRERSWMNLFAGEGYVVLLVDSFNPRGFRSICTMSKRPLTAEKDRPYDAYAALAWLREKPYVARERIGIMGWSHGAMTTLATISQAMVEETGWREPGFATAVAFYPGCLDLGKTRYQATVPLLLQLGEKDDWTPARHCEKLAAMMKTAGGRVEMDIYPGAYHGFDSPTGTVRTRSTSNTTSTRTVHVGRDADAAEKSIARAKAWFAAALKGETTPGSAPLP